MIELPILGDCRLGGGRPVHTGVAIYTPGIDLDGGIEVKVKRALNGSAAFRGCIINAENIGQSGDDLAAIRKGATDEYCQA